MPVLTYEQCATIQEEFLTGERGVASGAGTSCPNRLEFLSHINELVFEPQMDPNIILGLQQICHQGMEVKGEFSLLLLLKIRTKV